MATRKYISASENENNDREIRKHNWDVMKPFVKFGFGALKVLAHTFIFIVKGALKLKPEKPEEKTNKKVIKI